MEVKRSDDIGMRRGRVLSNLTQPKQLDLIAEGLPILMKSAGDLLAASNALTDHPRASAILDGHAKEEIAKILILMDIVRCPAKLRPSRIGPMITWFYDHLARLIYIDAQSWKPVNTEQLQEYVDHHRKSHYLEGAYGEYIMPNWTTLSREGRLYADLVAHEDGEPMWSDPVDWAVAPHYPPICWDLCQALRDVGAFTRVGLDVVSSVWSATEFVGDQAWIDIEELTHKMLVALHQAGLIAEAANERQLGLLYGRWQLPMYNIDFKRIEMPLEALQSERDANLWSAAGY
jgi:hypothetical protein